MRIPSVNLHPVLRWTLGVAGFYAVLVLFLWMYIHIANWDLGDRLIETKTVRERGPHEKDSPVVRLVLHRLFPDENSIEVSTVVTLSSSFCDDLLAHGVDHLEVQVEDFTGIQPISQLNTVHVDLKKRVPGFGELSVESERFRLPFFPSLVGFPFDSMRIRFYTAVRMPNWVGADAVLEVQKAIPGRTMEVGLDGGAVSVSISRSPAEQGLVILSAVVFLTFSAVISWKLMRSPKEMSGVEATVAVAGFVVAASGFREMIGIPRTSGTSALEIFTFGVPFLMITGATLLSLRRIGKGGLKAQPAEDNQPASH